MNVIQTGLEGLIILEPKTYCDERGLFYESWQSDRYKKLGIQETFVQDNVSISYKNVLRGMHYQKGQGQLVSVIQGKIFDVVIDIRQESLTYLKYFSIELSAEYPRQLYMSPGFAHGFYVVSDYVVMNYKCTQYYNKDTEGGLLWNDPALSILWPCSNPIVSEKDSKNLPYGAISALSNQLETEHKKRYRV